MSNRYFPRPIFGSVLIKLDTKKASNVVNLKAFVSSEFCLDGKYWDNRYYGINQNNLNFVQKTQTSLKLDKDAATGDVL